MEFGTVVVKIIRSNVAGITKLTPQNLTNTNIRNNFVIFGGLT